MSQRHKHADCIIAWANGAAIQYKPSDVNYWADAKSPIWYKDYDYRIKPRTIKIGEIEVPEPMREAPEMGAKYYIVDFNTEDNSGWSNWANDQYDKRMLARGLCHTTKEAAIVHAKALIRISSATV